MAIAITIKPQHSCNILNGIKEGEMRKNENLYTAIEKEIDEKGKATIYVICSKEHNINLYRIENNKFIAIKKDRNGYWHNGACYDFGNALNGKVVCKFECENVERIHHYKHIEPECDIGVGVLPSFEEEDYCGNEKEYEDHNWIYKKSRLSFNELDKYLNKKGGYFIHISNLTIFDKAKKISDLRFAKTYNFGDMHNCRVSLTKAPQNFCYVEDTL